MGGGKIGRRVNVVVCEKERGRLCVCVRGGGGGKRERERDKTRQDYFIVRPPAHYNRSEYSGNSNSHGSSDGLKFSFLVFKA